MKKSGFTLSEALLTFVILGFVTAMVVPSFIAKTKQRENIAGYHRAVNVLNKAYSEYLDKTTYKDYDNSGNKLFSFKSGDNPTTVSDAYIATMQANAPKMIGTASTENGEGESNNDGMDSAELILNRFIKKSLNIIQTSDSNETGNNKMAGCPDSNTFYFYTQDGMRYCIAYSVLNNDTFQENTYGVIWVDVNGNHGPNAVSTNANKPQDTFPIIIMKNRFIPGHPTNTEVSAIAQEIYFGKKTNSASPGTGDD